MRDSQPAVGHHPGMFTPVIFNPPPVVCIQNARLRPFSISRNWISHNSVAQAGVVTESKTWAVIYHIINSNISRCALSGCVRFDAYIEVLVSFPSSRGLPLRLCQQSLCQNPSYAECRAAWRASTTSWKTYLSERTGSMAYRWGQAHTPVAQRAIFKSLWKCLPGCGRGQR